jgi:maltooligosyltrehalose trehalohydrolase
MTAFEVWAPAAESVELVITRGRAAMQPADHGWWRLDRPDLTGEVDYRFVLDGGEPIPDPRSPRQPQGVRGPSRTVDHTTFDWHDPDWAGVPFAARVFYELHVGTFTPEGTFDAAAERLDHLVSLGVDLVELMPVHGFDGQHGWGYDGVALFAVHEPYGGPHGLKRFVDAAHRRGLGVVLDVVYNHLGPSGNYLARYGPYFTHAYRTPWGPAVNLDAPGSDEVRRFLVDNALGWLRDYHIDGLRLDAVHALHDQRAIHFLEELGLAVDRFGAAAGRQVFVVAESDANDPRVVLPRAASGYGMQAQWSDDFHHALHALLTGERQGYYVDFGSLATLHKALTKGFVHDGCWSTFRGRSHGRPFDRRRLSGNQLLGYSQNHDQVGNRALGDRTSALLSGGLLRVAAALVLTAPFSPLLFMGEEWGASTPWQFFTSFPDPALAEAVRSGRQAEFAEFGWPADRVPDPQDPATFARCKLDWSELDKPRHAELLDWYRRLIRLRNEWPELTDGRLDRLECDFDEQARWLVMRRGRLSVACNLADDPQVVPLPAPLGEVILHGGDDPQLATSSGERAITLGGRTVAIVAATA